MQINHHYLSQSIRLPGNFYDVRPSLCVSDHWLEGSDRLQLLIRGLLAYLHQLVNLHHFVNVH